MDSSTISILFQIIFWILFIFGITGNISTIVAASGLSTDSDNKGSSYILVLAGIFTFLIYFCATQIFQNNTPLLIWKISSGINVFVALMILLLVNIGLVHSLISLIIVMTMNCVPFMINASVDKISESSSVLGINNNYSGWLIPVSVLSILIVGVVIFVINTIISNKRIRKQLDLLRMLIGDNDIYNFQKRSFSEPYNYLLKEELSSLSRDINKYLSLTTKDMSRIIDEVASLKKTEKGVGSSVSKQFNEILIRNEIAEIRRSISVLAQQTNTKDYENLDVVKELNHFIATPFSAILSNVEIIKNKLGKHVNVVDNLDRIVDSINLCKCVIATYRESALIISGSYDSVISSLNVSLVNALKIYRESYGKINLEIDVKMPDKFDRYTNHYIASVLMPLLENAICASPDNAVVKLYVNDQGDIVLENECEVIPDIEDLNTQGYSSKTNHKGTGLMIARHLLKIKDQGKHVFRVENNRVKQIIQLNNK